MTVRRRQRLARVGSWLVLVFVLMPAITYMGHWPIAGEAPHVEANDDPQSVLDEHAAHCHVGVSHCAGGEAMVGAMWVGEKQDLISFDAPHQAIESVAHASPVEGEPVLLLQPPQMVAEGQPSIV